ncbi:LysR family transcriptional regulator [Paenibacillus roseipurpureus]|uniref:LysR family transcriptional regulator n=1 Tax=Paenibacillus roseopurpureus TaxID=2918901 RepID=A0AA96RKK8_9BACL|nr:LysR family transcriptional regulator [Paenibacillus sp. MBLB1832]WNR46473.1 LysR family transcriptional regulator [Paenibacillus sp. MBLB1832]
MDLTYFRTFREVARRKSFTRAAEELGYAQSSITMQIQKLEREYGVPLFERYGRQLRLTPPGETLLVLTLQMLELYDQSKEMIASQVSGTLTIGTIHSLAAYYLPPFLHELKKLYPTLNIQLFPDSEASILAKVKDGDYDIGLLLDQYPADPSLACTKVREEQLVVIAPQDHPLSRESHISISALGAYEFIVTEEGCIYRGKFERLLKEQAIALQIGFELGNIETIKHCVMSGLGLALLPLITVESELELGKLVRLPFTHTQLAMDLQFVLHPKKWMSQPLQAFINNFT